MNTAASLKNDQKTNVIVELNKDKCKGCALCVVICPKGCLVLDPQELNTRGFNPAKFNYNGTRGRCNACGLCYMVCPDYAVTTIKKLVKGVFK